MTTPLVIVGAGGFGREVLDIIDAINARTGGSTYQPVGFLDDGQPDMTLLNARQVAHLGPIESAQSLSRDHQYVTAIGDGNVRKAVSDRLARSGRRAATLIHPTAILGFGVECGEGTIVCAGVSISTNVRTGRHVQLHPGCTVGHDADLADYVTVTPQAAISGAVTVGECSWIGAGSSVRQGVAIGRRVVVGLGAVVLADVPDDVTAVGVPARAISH